MAKKKSNTGLNIKPIILITGLILVPITIYLIYRIGNTNERLIPISVIALICGAIIESLRLTRKLLTIILLVFGSFILSFFIFIPGEHESIYNLNDHLIMWPYSFLFFFVIFSIVVNKDKIIPRLTEGITLIQSIVIIYWILDNGFFSTSSVLMKVLIIIGLLFSTFSFLNAFTKINLTKGIRLALSIWSAIIMIALAIDYIFKVYSNRQIEDLHLNTDKCIIGIEYFLLGVSSIYIVQNFMMLAGYLPSKYRFFNSDYFNDIRELTNDHLDRYSNNQTSIYLSISFFILAGSFLFLNYKFKFISRGMAIWIVFFLCNNVLYFYENTIKNYRRV